MAEDGWERVGRAIAVRIADLGITKAEVVRRSGVSATSLDAFIGGQPIKRRDKLAGICSALEWAPSSIEAVLAGGAPVELSGNGHRPDLEQRINAMAADNDRRFASIEEDLAGMREVVEQLRDHLRGGV